MMNAPEHDEAVRRVRQEAPPMHPSLGAALYPDRAAIIMAESGATVSYAELDAGSNRVAHLFRAQGFVAGDVVAVMLENRPELLIVSWAAQRAGLYWTAISSRLLADEIDHILRDSGARMLITSPMLGAIATEIRARLPDLPIAMVEPGLTPFVSLVDACAGLPTTPIADEVAGIDMLYSSGTTGRPKGIKPALPRGAIDAPNGLTAIASAIFGFETGCVYLCPAPLYHAAPLRWSMVVHRLGGTVVVMEKFDPEEALRLIERYRVDCGQFVPTHFVRMLKLPEAARTRYDLSSLKSVVHAAAPCPVPVKEAMIAWWGPIVHEYYAGTEGNGLCAINATDWLAHKGSVGRAVLGTVRICDEDGEPVVAGTEGLIHFDGGPPLVYHNDPDKTAASHNRHGWSTLGDVGYIDADGFLYLTDRKSFMIISGGVNIYPQEIEDLLIAHPKVADAAVIGAPDDDFGEKIVAVVQPFDPVDAGPGLADELRDFLRARLSPIKTPRLIDFVAELPRQPTGKLNKRMIRAGYWP